MSRDQSKSGGFSVLPLTQADLIRARSSLKQETSKAKLSPSAVLIDIGCLNAIARMRLIRRSDLYQEVDREASSRNDPLPRNVPALEAVRRLALPAGSGGQSGVVAGSSPAARPTNPTTWPTPARNLPSRKTKRPAGGNDDIVVSLTLFLATFLLAQAIWSWSSGSSVPSGVKIFLAILPVVIMVAVLILGFLLVLVTRGARVSGYLDAYHAYGLDRSR